MGAKSQSHVRIGYDLNPSIAGVYEIILPILLRPTRRGTMLVCSSTWWLTIPKTCKEQRRGIHLLRRIQFTPRYEYRAQFFGSGVLFSAIGP